MITLTNKVILVTGAGQGIGLQICRELAGAGARVILNDLDTALAGNGKLFIRLSETRK